MRKNRPFLAAFKTEVSQISQACSHTKQKKEKNKKITLSTNCMGNSFSNCDRPKAQNQKYVQQNNTMGDRKSSTNDMKGKS